MESRDLLVAPSGHGRRPELGPSLLPPRLLVCGLWLQFPLGKNYLSSCWAFMTPPRPSLGLLATCPCRGYNPFWVDLFVEVLGQLLSVGPTSHLAPGNTLCPAVRGNLGHTASLLSGVLEVPSLTWLKVRRR